jgi:hopanoid biosynthesis associated RND transporter like protein HpnN
MLHRLLDALLKRPAMFLFAQLGALAVCIGLSLALDVRTDITDLVGEDLEFYRNDVRFETEFPAKDELIVVVESSEPRRNRRFVERLAAKLDAEPALFTNIFYKSDLSTLGPKGMLFLPEENLEAIRQRLADSQALIQPLTVATNLDSLLRLVNARFEEVVRNPQADTSDVIRAVPVLESLLEQAQYAIEHTGIPTAPGVTALFSGERDAERQYLSIAEGRFFMLTAQPRNREVLPDAVERLRTLLKQTQVEVPGNNVGLTGLPVLHMDERIQVSSDITMAALFALVLCTFIFIFAYQETGRPLKASACLVIGMGYAMGLAALTIGHLNLLSITFAPILIGLSIDAGVHLITRYEEDLRTGKDAGVALRKALIFTGAGILTSALATASAFFAMTLTDFKGIREMGIIAGGGLLVCLIPMMTLLPLWLIRGRQNEMDVQAPQRGSRREAIEQSWLRRPGFTVLVCGLLTLLALTQVQKVRFEHNPLVLQSAGLASVELADKLMATGDKSVAFASVDVATLEEAAEMEPKLAALPSVASVESMSKFLTADQTRKLQLVRDIKKEVMDIDLPEVDRGSIDLESLNETLYRLQGYLGLAAGEMRRQNNQKIFTQLLRIQQSIGALLDSDWRRAAATMASRLKIYQQALFDDLHHTLATIQNQNDTEPLRIHDLPESLRNRFVGITGRHVMRIYPRKNAWNRENQAEFISEIRTIAPWVTGTPVLLYEYIGLLSKSYREAVIYAVIIMAVLVWVHFRSMFCVFLALIPIGMGTVWLLGLMGALGIAFNPVNIMTIPLLVGIGVTNGIHILNRYSEESCPSMLAKSTGKAVLVSALTTIAGFGSLMLAHHRGIASLGYVMSIGVAACLIAALALLPCVIQLLGNLGWTVNKGGEEEPTRQRSV